MTRRIVHLEVGGGLSTMTLCGKTVHLYHKNHPVITSNPAEVTCSACLQEMGLA